jgi:sulfoxide reductase heme-binding subunit YedZ
MQAPVRNLAWFATQHFVLVRRLSFLACLTPALWLSGEWLTRTLGVNPLNRLLHFTGRCAMVMLLITLSITPVRRFSMKLSQLVRARFGKRVSDWNWLIRLRRQLGLFTFFYACLHMACYAVLDAGLDLASIRDDILERPFIVAGFCAYILLVPLAATSNQASMRALGRNWQRLHTLSYLIAVLALTHFWMQMKLGHATPVPDSVVLTVLLAARFYAWRMGDRSRSVEVHRNVSERRDGAAA